MHGISSLAKLLSPNLNLLLSYLFLFVGFTQTLEFLLLELMFKGSPTYMEIIAMLHLQLFFRLFLNFYKLASFKCAGNVIVLAQHYLSLSFAQFVSLFLAF